jgi:DNA-binding MarR family transcriptional regulator
MTMSSPTPSHDPSPRASDLRRHLFALGAVVYDVLEKRPLEQLEGGRVTPDQLRMLRVLHIRPQMRVGEVALAMGIKTSSASLALDRLEAKGFLARRTDRDDRRVTRLLLTPRGEEVFREAEGISGARFLEVLRDFDDEEVEEFVSMCARLIRSLVRTEGTSATPGFPGDLLASELDALADASRSRRPARPLYRE